MRNWCTKWKIGDRIQDNNDHDRWEILKILNGGMGIVYIVHDHAEKCRLAMKTFQRFAGYDIRVLSERFKKEALAWVQINAHPNVVRARSVVNLRVAHDIDGKTIVEMNQPFLLMDYIAGGDLAAWIGKPELAHDIGQVIRFALQFCDGMGHVLSNGIVAHRDIKPSNCLITEDRVLKVTDFGLVKVFDDPGRTSTDWKNKPPAIQPETSKPPGTAFGASLTARSIGTCDYMAPEQFENSKPADVRADIYAFGVMLFEMITGRRPYAAQDFHEFKRLHQEKSTPRLDALVEGSPTLTTQLNKLLQACLAKAPEERIGSFNLVRERLASLHEQVTGRQVGLPLKAEELNARALTDKATNLKALGRKQEDVLPLYDEALQLEPLNDYAWLAKADALIGYGRMKDALECFESVLRFNPESIDGLNGKGDLLAHFDRQLEALQCFEAVLKLKPHNRMAYAGKGWRLAALDRKEEALAHFEAILKGKPDDLELQESVTLLQEAINAKRDGFAQVRRMKYLSRLRPGNTIRAEELPEAQWTKMAGGLWTSGRQDEALACLDRAVAVNPRYVPAWNNKGDMLREMKRHEEALACFARVLEINQQLKEAWCGKGRTLAGLARDTEALACFDRALALDPRYYLAWNNKGISLTNLNRFKDAVACYARAIQINPREWFAWNNAGATLSIAGRYNEAITYLMKAQQLGSPKAAPLIASCQEQLGGKP
jgi:serine/threonine protein kinase/lipoprotein NlpI